LTKQGKIFFASDFHLGLNAGSDPSEREKKVVAWLNRHAPEARAFYLLGDVFDFWWEYRLVVPKGFSRFLGAVATIVDSGIPVHFFTGNHDMWVGDYFRNECGMTIHTGPITEVLDGKIFHLAHGEGLGSRNKGYRILLNIFHNRPLRALYSSLHPRIGVWIGHKWSLSSRLGKGISKEFMGEENEDLLRYASDISSKQKTDYFIFGHRHLLLEYEIKTGSRVIILGDWLSSGNHAEWDGSELKLIRH